MWLPGGAGQILHTWAIGCSLRFYCCCYCPPAKGVHCCMLRLQTAVNTKLLFCTASSWICAWPDEQASIVSIADGARQGRAGERSGQSRAEHKPFTILAQPAAAYNGTDAVAWSPGCEGTQATIPALAQTR
jgi:hypothetical protein